VLLVSRIWDSKIKSINCQALWRCVFLFQKFNICYKYETVEIKVRKRIAPNDIVVLGGPTMKFLNNLDLKLVVSFLENAVLDSIEQP
ncbi:hypothetical protein, partial [Leptospira weilii]|uniref:hypothetical protein n=1 Tax=Leptospira weilii TaxID=28184 RepID=UPI000774E5D8